MSMQDKMMTVSHYLDTATSARNPYTRAEYIDKAVYIIVDVLRSYNVTVDCSSARRSFAAMLVDKCNLTAPETGKWRDRNLAIEELFWLYDSELTSRAISTGIIEDVALRYLEATVNYVPTTLHEHYEKLLHCTSVCKDKEVIAWFMDRYFLEAREIA